MGLDMYLYKKSYVKNWQHMKPESLHKITIKKGGKVRKDIKTDRITYIIEEVAYWRKANAIHCWMVDNLQGGTDDCGEYYVSRKNIEDLLAIINDVLNGSKLVNGKVVNGYTLNKDGENEPILEDGKVIVDNSLASKLLPTADGFFFGGTNYDEYYIRDLEYTREIFGEILKEEVDGDGDYYYQSSW